LNLLFGVLLFEALKKFLSLFLQPLTFPSDLTQFDGAIVALNLVAVGFGTFLRLESNGQESVCPFLQQ
jgi:hypothetical protein